MGSITTRTPHGAPRHPPGALLAALTAAVLVTTSCSAAESSRVPAARSDPPATATPSATPPEPGSAAVGGAAVGVATRVSVGEVAGRLDLEDRARVKQAVTEVVDRYLDGAWLGTYPRTDFSAGLVDFRDVARRDAERDLSLLTNVDRGATTGAATATWRRLRIDVLSPRGRPRAATSRFGLDLGLTGSAGDPAGSVRVRGSLLLSNERGAWRVFGYDVTPEVLP